MGNLSTRVSRGRYRLVTFFLNIIFTKWIDSRKQFSSHDYWTVWYQEFFLLKSIVRFSFEIDCQFRNNSVRKIFFANKNPGLCRKWWRQRAFLIYQWIRSPVIPFFWMKRLLMKYHGKTKEKNSEFTAIIWEKIESNFNSNWASILYPWIYSNSSTLSPVSPSSSHGYPNQANPNW